MGSPLSDKIVSLSGASESSATNTSSKITSIKAQITRQADGSFQMFGARKASKYDLAVRLNINTPRDAEPLLMYNTNNDSAVRMHSYLDINPTNHWRKVMDTLDNGGGGMPLLRTTYSTVLTVEGQKII